MARFRYGASAVLALLTSLAIWPAIVQASNCFAYVEQRQGVVPVAYAPAQAAGAVEVTYIGHSTFRLETPAGVVIATDYNGYAGPGPAPTVVTMNHAHDTHFTNAPDPAIRHVLRGWNPEGGPAVHDLTVEDVYIRNVPTDIRSGFGGIERFGNSIFIFEVADLCIGHLGHLHHKPDAEQLARIGRLDVVFAPVDGSMTLDLPSMIEVLKELRASLVIPMHYFGRSSLNVFLGGMAGDFEVRVAQDRTVDLSLRGLPERPTVLVLGGG